MWLVDIKAPETMSETFGQSCFRQVQLKRSPRHTAPPATVPWRPLSLKHGALITGGVWGHCKFASLWPPYAALQEMCLGRLGT